MDETGDAVPIEELLDSPPDDWEHRDPREAGGLGIKVVSWRTLPEEKAAETWADLGDWVAWFIWRYEIPARKIPPCWYRHGHLVEELSALHTAHLVSFDSLDAGYGPIGFHERLELAWARLARAYAGQCHDGHTTITAPAPTPDPDDWAEWTTRTHGDNGVRAL